MRRPIVRAGRVDTRTYSRGREPVPGRTDHRTRRRSSSPRPGDGQRPPVIHYGVPPAPLDDLVALPLELDPLGPGPARILVIQKAAGLERSPVGRDVPALRTGLLF